MAEIKENAAESVQLEKPKRRKMEQKQLKLSANESYKEEFHQINETQEHLISAVKEQAEETKKLNTTIQNLSNNLDKGFTVLQTGAGLFKLVIFTFLFVVLLLGAIIVYITHTEIDFKNMTIKEKVILQQSSDIKNPPIVTFKEE